MVENSKPKEEEIKQKEEIKQNKRSNKRSC